MPEPSIKFLMLPKKLIKVWNTLYLRAIKIPFLFIMRIAFNYNDWSKVIPGVSLFIFFASPITNRSVQYIKVSLVESNSITDKNLITAYSGFWHHPFAVRCLFPDQFRLFRFFSQCVIISCKAGMKMVEY